MYVPVYHVKFYVKQLRALVSLVDVCLSNVLKCYKNFISFIDIMPTIEVNCSKMIRQIR